jgi:hypothetical protein
MQSKGIFQTSKGGSRRRTLNNVINLSTRIVSLILLDSFQNVQFWIEREHGAVQEFGHDHKV